MVFIPAIQCKTHIHTHTCMRAVKSWNLMFLPKFVQVFPTIPCKEFYIDQRPFKINQIKNKYGNYNSSTVVTISENY